MSRRAVTPVVTVVARIPYCPAGQHRSLAVREADLTEGERPFARAHHDLPVP